MIRRRSPAHRPNRTNKPAGGSLERLPHGPPALVSFLPGFWLLVPGALSLIGVTEYLGHDAVRGSADLLSALASMLAVALGVLCRHPLHRALARWVDAAGREGPAAARWLTHRRGTTSTAGTGRRPTRDR